MKIWRDINEPSSTDYTWIRLNEYGEITGTLKYKGGKWVLVKSASGKNGNVDLSEIVNGAPEELDTLGEIASALGELTNTIGGISNTVSGLSTTVGGLSTTVEGLTNAKTTTLSASSTDAQYPSAKVVYDTIVDNEEVTAAALCDLDEREKRLEEQVGELYELISNYSPEPTEPEQ